MLYYFFASKRILVLTELLIPERVFYRWASLLVGYFARGTRQWHEILTETLGRQESSLRQLERFIIKQARIWETHSPSPFDLASLPPPHLLVTFDRACKHTRAQRWRLMHSWAGWQSQTVRSRVINAFASSHKPAETQWRSRVINSRTLSSQTVKCVLHVHWARSGRERRTGLAL